MAGKSGWGTVLGVLVSPAKYAAFAWGLSAGWSATSIIESLKGTSLAIRRQVGLAVAREITGGLKAGGLLSGVSLDKTISADRIPVSSRVMRDSYKYWGEFKWRDKDTGQQRKETTSWYASRNQTRREIESTLREHATGFSQYVGGQSVEVELTAVYRQGE